MSSAEPAVAVQTRGLTRDFGRVRAVDDLSIEVRAGTIFGFLGPNGAGKTTTIRLLLGLLEPTVGEARVLGHDVRTEAHRVREKAGVLLEADGVYTRLTALENLDYFARISRIPAADRKSRIRDLLTAMDLWERRNGRVVEYSTGMRQKLALARAFLHRRQLLFLDEPTSGLDTPSAVAMRRELVKLAREEGVTVFLTTHNLLEAEKVCDRVAVIRRGRLLAEGGPEELHAGRSRRVLIHGSGIDGPLAVRVAGLPTVKRAELADGGGLAVELAPQSDAAPVVRLLVESGADVSMVEAMRESLEEIFLKLVREVEDGEPPA
jgi:ABC-2 type transport system ATP-binding protein